ncbi:hypothetical protein HYQ46_011292 [Verticillium longisporum]|nr:hypothetical protein HYQ46_011292 [Verticillium longisporum]
MDWHQLEQDNGGNPTLVRIAHEVMDEKGERVVRLTDVEQDGWHGRSRTVIKKGYLLIQGLFLVVHRCRVEKSSRLFCAKIKSLNAKKIRADEL